MSYLIFSTCPTSGLNHGKEKLLIIVRLALTVSLYINRTSKKHKIIVGYLFLCSRLYDLSIMILASKDNLFLIC